MSNKVYNDRYKGKYVSNKAKKLTVAHLLVDGYTKSQAAAEVCVSSQAITNWFKECPYFNMVYSGLQTKKDNSVADIVKAELAVETHIMKGIRKNALIEVCNNIDSLVELRDSEEELDPKQATIKLGAMKLINDIAKMYAVPESVQEDNSDEPIATEDEQERFIDSVSDTQDHSDHQDNAEQPSSNQQEDTDE